MIRDPRSFAMDFFFPMLLIWLGLWVSTLELINQDLPARNLSAYDYPHGRPLVYNLHNFNQTEGEVTEFIEKGFGSDVGPGKLFSEYKPINTDTDDHFFNQSKQIDDIIFEQRNEVGAQYGQYFIQQVNAEERYYAIGIFLNASSISAPVSYTAYALQAIMRDILSEPDLRLNFSERPLPFGFKLQTYVNAG